MTKRCSRCKDDKSTLVFGKDKRCPDGLNRRCKTCIKAIGQENQEKIRAAAKKTYERHKERRLAECKKYLANLPASVKQTRNRVKRLKLYGLTEESFRLLAERQNNRCAICDGAFKLHVDHDHKTNKVRGLLCFDCNTSLGKLQECPDILERARDYMLSGGIL